MIAMSRDNKKNVIIITIVVIFVMRYFPVFTMFIIDMLIELNYIGK